MPFLYKDMKSIAKIYFLIMVLVLASCGKKADEVKKTEEAVKPKVRIQQAVAREVEQSYEFAATVEPVVKNNINPTAPGRIRQIFVEVGDQVAKGQKLAQMDAVNLVNSESQIENLKRIFKRVNELFAVGGASQQELDNAKLQLTLAEANLKNLQENTMLVSPVSGMVTARNYDGGDMYAGQMPILTVMQINPVQLKINVSESYFVKVKSGMSVKVKLDVYPGEEFTGKVSLKYPTIDERTRTFPVEVTISNPGNKIRPGMFARVEISFGKEKRVVIPDLAVVKQPGSGVKYVYLHVDGKVLYREIEVGRRMNTEYEIISGIDNGAEIVVSGQSKVTDGVLVDVVK
jgi:RND family efflux transporter MFP subunit